MGKETKARIITIDLDNKQIHTSNSKIKSLLLNSKEVTGNVFSSLNLNSFDIVNTLTKNKGRTIGDKLDLKGIKKYVKDNKNELVDELESLINSQAKDKSGKPVFKKDGTPKKVSFLVIKNWFYEKFPDQKPKKDK